MSPRVFSTWLHWQPDGVQFVQLADAEPTPTLAWVILSTFALVGLALLITIAIGAGVGVLRIWIRGRFPNNRWNGRDEEPMVRLKLSEPSPGADPSAPTP